MQKFNSFADLANARIELADSRDGIVESYDGAFVEHSDLAKLSIIDEPIAAEMPDPDMARRAVEMAIGTIFDVLKDTRMEEFAQQLAWGMVNSFHMTARLAEGREDDAAKKLGELARHFDPSEIYAVELEETQALCQTLQGCREALEAMRDHAADVYRVETGRVYHARTPNDRALDTRQRGAREGGQSSHDCDGRGPGTPARGCRRQTTQR